MNNLQQLLEQLEASGKQDAITLLLIAETKRRLST